MPECEKAIQFAFIQQLVTLEFPPQEDLCRNLRNAPPVGLGHDLNLQHVNSNDGRVLMLSPTGSTQVQITSSQVTLSTQLFADYAKPANSDLRVSYLQKKLAAILTVLADKGVVFSYIGVSTIARASARQVNSPDELRSAAVQASGVDAAYLEGEECFDFTVRMSHVSGSDCFTNATLQWYQDRSFVLNSLELAQAAAARVPIWDMQLTDQGVEFRYDRNNKHGLFEGRRTWSVQELEEIACSTVVQAPKALAPISLLINTRLAR